MSFNSIAIGKHTDKFNNKCDIICISGTDIKAETKLKKYIDGEFICELNLEDYKNSYKLE